jgi:hypothetical protein
LLAAVVTLYLLLWHGLAKIMLGWLYGLAVKVVVHVGGILTSLLLLHGRLTEGLFSLL